VKSKLIYLTSLSGRKASVYTIVSEDTCTSLFDKFIIECKNEFPNELMNILSRLKRVGNNFSALESWFKLDEGLHWNDHICAFYDVPDRNLRLFCIRLSEKIIILGNGGPKNVRAWQDDSRLSREVHEMMLYSKIIHTQLENKHLKLSGNRLKLEGNLLLTR
jgi:hypothetical protein